MRSTRPNLGERSRLMNSIRLMLAHELALPQAALHLLLAAEPGFEVVSESCDPETMRKRVREVCVDVVVMSISASAGFDISAIGSLGRPPQPRVVAMSPRDDAAFVRTLMSAGASAFVCEKSPPKELILAIREVASGRTFIDSHVARRVGNLRFEPPSAQKKSPAFLSQRESEVLKLLARGFTNQQVADSLSLSVKTAETYRVRLTRKLGFKSRSELFRYAFDIGMIGQNEMVNNK